MLSERLQILVDAEQRRRLEAEARRRQTSVGSLVREAVDAHLGHVSKSERLEALDRIRTASSGRHVSLEEIEQAVDDERQPDLPASG